MKKPAALASPRIWGGKIRQGTRIPRFFVMSDTLRLPDPEAVFDHLPQGGAVVLRHTDPVELTRLAQDILPKAHARGLKVLISNDVRLAHRLGADGVHLSQAKWRQGHWRRTLSMRKPSFIITAALHPAKALRSGEQHGPDAVLVSPVFVTESHPDVAPIGIFRFLALVKSSPRPIIALGGMTADTVRRLKGGQVYGVAAIGAWRD